MASLSLCVGAQKTQAGLPAPVIARLLQCPIARVVDFMHFHLHSRGATLEDGSTEPRNNAAANTIKEYRNLRLRLQVEDTTTFGAHILRVNLSDGSGSKPDWLCQGDSGSLTFSLGSGVLIHPGLIPRTRRIREPPTGSIRATASH